jgi:hypothetical protein
MFPKCLLLKYVVMAELLLKQVSVVPLQLIICTSNVLTMCNLQYDIPIARQMVFFLFILNRWDFCPSQRQTLGGRHARWGHSERLLLSETSEYFIFLTTVEAVHLIHKVKCRYECGCVFLIENHISGPISARFCTATSVDQGQVLD